MLMWLLLMVICAGALKFQSIGFDAKQIRVIDDAMGEWNDGANLFSLVRIAPNKIINDRISNMGIGVTIKKTYTTNEIRYDIIIDATKARFDNVLFNIALHELGHSIGLVHNDDRRSIMNSSIDLDENYYALDQPRHRLGLVDRCAVFMNGL